jgi:hypothetical protein
MIGRTAREVFEELAGEHLSRPEAGRRSMFGRDCLTVSGHNVAFFHDDQPAPPPRRRPRADALIADRMQNPAFDRVLLRTRIDQRALIVPRSGFRPTLGAGRAIRPRQGARRDLRTIMSGPVRADRYLPGRMHDQVDATGLRTLGRRPVLSI